MLDAMRHAKGGGKRMRPPFACCQQAFGGDFEPALVMCALEFIHLFTDHDDLPAMDTTISPRPSSDTLLRRGDRDTRWRQSAFIGLSGHCRQRHRPVDQSKLRIPVVRRRGSGRPVANV